MDCAHPMESFDGGSDGEAEADSPVEQKRTTEVGQRTLSDPLGDEFRTIGTIAKLLVFTILATLSSTSSTGSDSGTTAPAPLPFFFAASRPVL